MRHATCPLAPAEEIARGWLTAHALTSMRCRPETCDARAREGFLCLTGHRKRTTRGHTVARIRIKEPKRIRLLQGGCCTFKSACEEPNHMFRSEGVRCGDIKSEERSSRRLAAWVVHVPRSVTSVQFTHHRSRKHTAHTRHGLRESLRTSSPSVLTLTLATHRRTHRSAARRTAAGVLPGAHWRHCAPLSVPSLVLHSCAHAAGTSQLKRSGPIDGARCNQGSMKVTFLSKAATAAARTSGGMPFRRPSKCSSTGVLPE